MMNRTISTRWVLCTVAICASTAVWAGWISELVAAGWLLGAAVWHLIEVENRLVDMARAADRRDFDLVTSLNHLDSRINGLEYDLGDERSRMQVRISDLESAVASIEKALEAGRLKVGEGMWELEQKTDAIKETLEAEQSRMREEMWELRYRARASS
jgi:hypothetical protein